MSHPDYNHPFPKPIEHWEPPRLPPDPDDREEELPPRRQRIRDRIRREHVLVGNSTLNTWPAYMAILRHPFVWWPLVMLTLIAMEIPAALFGGTWGARVGLAVICFGFLLRPRKKT